MAVVGIEDSRAGIEESEGTSLGSRLMQRGRMPESVAERIREGAIAARLVVWLSVSLVTRFKGLRSGLAGLERAAGSPDLREVA